MAPVDQALLDEALRARKRCTDLELELAQRQADFGRAVQRLHASGASLREIAVALEISHQRVHQLVGPGATEGLITRLTRLGRRGGHRSLMSCSFCGATQIDTQRLVAGPGVWICDQCIGSATRVATGEGPTDQAEQASFSAVPRDEHGTRCEFCGRGLQRPDRILRGGRQGRTICQSCLRLCNEILAERPDLSR